MKLVCHGSPSQCPPLHIFSSSSSFNALKLTESKRRSKSELNIIDFDNIDVYDIKYLPSYFKGDVLFMLFLVRMVVPSAYGRSIDGMDKMCNGHPWCT
jgi:hypothetical protein